MLGKSVFMTGASGFIGSHLSEELEMRGITKEDLLDSASATA